MAIAHESRRQTGPACALAGWATAFEPTPDDLALADRALVDTIAVMQAAREHPLRPLFEKLTAAGRAAATAHVLDFDDLHLPSTTHISAVCVSAALATGGGARAYLAGAGVMARLGTALGWRHYAAGWHATCTAGAPAAAVTAAIAHELDAKRTATAIALAVPAAGGTQRAFGTASKALQVGFATDAGVRAAELAAAGATADPGAMDQWMALVNAQDPIELEGAAVPGGLATKLYPCCYALQRPIAATASLPPLDHNKIRRIRITTPAASLKPLIHKHPTTGLEGKFSLEYAVAAYLIDGRADLDTFTDAAVNRAAVHALIEKIEVVPTDQQGEDLLTGTFRIAIDDTASAELAIPPGAPARPPTPAEREQKLKACNAGGLTPLTWDTAAKAL